jgi:SAM-dependent methyltransferase
VRDDMPARAPVQKDKDVFNDKRFVDAHPTHGLFDDERKAIAKYFKGGRVLDLGCASGRTSIELSKMGYDVDAVDYAETMIERAKAIHADSPVRFQVMDVRALAFANGTFDYILFSSNGLDSLYPVSERLKALQEIQRVLKPGGILLFTSHNAVWLPSKWNKAKRILHSFSKGWIHPYRLDISPLGEWPMYHSWPGAVRRQLKSAGMRLVEIRSDHSARYLGILKRDPYPLYVATK